MKKTTLLLTAFSFAGLAFGSAQAGEISSDPAQAKKDVQAAADWLDGKLDSYGDFKVTYAGPVIEMRVSSHIPAVAGLAKMQVKGWQILERMSNNKIKVSTSWSQAVHPANGGREALRAGLTDAAPCFTIYHSRDYDMMNGTGLPFLFENTREASAVIQHLYPKYLKKEFEKYGVMLQRIQMNSPYHLYTANKQVRTLDDMKGLKVRGAGGIDSEIITALGGTAISMPATDAYSAMQNGTIDGIHFADLGAAIFKIDQVAKYRTVNGFNSVTLEYCVRSDFFEKLPSDLKVVFNAWAQQYNMAEAIIGYDYDSDIVLAKMVKKTGIETIKLPPAELARWKDKLKGIEDGWIAKTSAKGLPAKEFIAEAKKLAAKYDAMTPNELMLDAIKNPVQGMRGN